MPVPVPKYETTSVTLVDAASPTTLDFRQEYVEPVVLTNCNDSPGKTSAVASRAYDVTSTSAKIELLDFATGAGTFDSVSEQDVTVAVFESFESTADGLHIKAGTVEVSGLQWTDRRNNAPRNNFVPPFATLPVVVTSIQSRNTAFPQVTNVRSRTVDRFNVARECAEAIPPQETIDTPETVGYVAIAGGSSNDWLKSRVETGLTPDEVRGVTNDPADKWAYDFATPFDEPPALLHGQIGRDGGDGGWSRATLAPTTTTAYFQIDEDTVGDEERGHTSEDVNYIALPMGVAESYSERRKRTLAAATNDATADSANDATVDVSNSAANAGANDATTGSANDATTGSANDAVTNQ